ncbi:putative Progestin and adipoQ receptor family member 3-like isoform X1 protein, partial [Naja naja]
GSA